MLQDSLEWSSEAILVATGGLMETIEISESTGNSPFVPFGKVVDNLGRNFHVLDLALRWDPDISRWTGRILMESRASDPKQRKRTTVSLRSYASNEIELGFFDWKHVETFRTSDDVENRLPATPSQWEDFLDELHKRPREMNQGKPGLFADSANGSGCSRGR